MRYLILLLLCCQQAFGQIDTTSYPQERAQIRQLIHSGKRSDCNDFIAVGPKGDISFSQQQWKNVQDKKQVVFKSVEPVPGNEFIRIYDGNVAVINFLADVKLLVAGRDVNIKVRRLEVYHKSADGWCRVAGQGTEVSPE